jgi:hypothetical protein
MLEERKPYPKINTTNPDVSLAYCRIYHVENGTRTMFYYGNPGELANYLANLLRETNDRQAPINDQYLEKVLASGKALWINYRASVTPTTQPFIGGYFIMEDDSVEGLAGMFLVRLRYGVLYRWAIKN